MKKIIMFMFCLFLFGACENKNVVTKVKSNKVEENKKNGLAKDENNVFEDIKDNKFVIYQSLVRLFGNKKHTNKFNGTYE